MVDLHYTNERLAAIYDLDSGWSIKRDFYVRFAGSSANTVLDVACGTGLIARRLAQSGHSVVGVDPAGAMLEVAQRGFAGHLVEWVHAGAKDFELDRAFDRIIMTGNAFQVLLSEEDLTATLDNLRRHLAEGGRIAFETRNPEIDWSTRWDYDVALDTPSGAVRQRRRLLSRDGAFLRFELIYDFPDETLRSQSTLRFWSEAEVRLHVASAGLRVDCLCGDWNGGPLDQARSEEMIFILEARDGPPPAGD